VTTKGFAFMQIECVFNFSMVVYVTCSGRVLFDDFANLNVIEFFEEVVEGFLVFKR
jgi:hypothetical protein